MATFSPQVPANGPKPRDARPFWRKHFLKLTLLPLGAIVALWFLVIQPRTSTTVDEALPTAAPVQTTIAAAQPTATTGAVATAIPRATQLTTVASAPANAPTAPPAIGAAPSAAGPVAVKSGSFGPSVQTGSGKATIYKQPDGKYILRLEDFAVSNGPDLRVRLLGPNGASLELGGLKGNKGNQNYDLPADFDPAKYNTADIWCRTFREQFIKAALA